METSTCTRIEHADRPDGRTRLGRARHGAALLLLPVLLSACSGLSDAADAADPASGSPGAEEVTGSSGTADPTDEPSPPLPSSTATPPAQPPAPPEGGASSYPIDLAYAEIYGEPGFTDTDLIERHQLSADRIQEQVAACMAEAGFEYIPFSQVGTTVTTAELPAYRDLDPLERARQIGYGFIDDIVASAAVELLPDPNIDVVARLSRSDQDAWWAALEGEQGCRASVSWDPTLSAIENDERWLRFIDGVLPVYEAAAADPRQVEIDAGWSACMDGAGYEHLRTPDDAFTLAIEPWNAWTMQAPSGSLPDPVKLGQLREQEITVAVADETCRSAVDYRLVAAAVQTEYQQAYVDSRANDIAALIALGERARAEA